MNDVSTDQHYAYKICSAIIMGVVDSDLQYLKVGPIVHSRWLWAVESSDIMFRWMCGVLLRHYETK